MGAMRVDYNWPLLPLKRMKRRTDTNPQGSQITSEKARLTTVGCPRSPNLYEYPSEAVTQVLANPRWACLNLGYPYPLRFNGKHDDKPFASH